jgi:hypothetical protein
MPLFSSVLIFSNAFLVRLNFPAAVLGSGKLYFSAITCANFPLLDIGQCFSSKIVFKS